MTDDRDRRAAEEWLDANDGPAVPPRSAVDSLAAFRAAARAEAHARAIEQAVEVVTTCWKCSASVHASPLPHCLDECSPQRFEEGDEAPHSDTASAIRALRPDPDLVVVRREDLAHVMGTCGCNGAYRWPAEHNEALDRVRGEG